MGRFPCSKARICAGRNDRLGKDGDNIRIDAAQRRVIVRLRHGALAVIDAATAQGRKIA